MTPQSTPKHVFTGFGPNAESDTKTHRSYGGKQKKSVYLCSVVISCGVKNSRSETTADLGHRGGRGGSDAPADLPERHVNVTSSD